MSLPAAFRVRNALVVGERPIAHGGATSVQLAAVREADGVAAAVRRRLHPHLQEIPEVAMAFLRTVSLRGHLQRDGIVPRVFDRYTDEEGVLNVVEEHAGDVRFSELLEDRRAAGRPMPVGFAIRLARTLVALHMRAEELVVRARCEYRQDDVLLDWDGAMRVLVEDGPAWHEQSHGAAVGILRGSFALLSPERVRGMRVDFRSDLYTIGVMAWIALVGEHPLHENAESEVERLRRTIERDVPSPRDARRDVPEDLAAVVVRCTRRDPETRYGSWVELLDALHDAAKQAEPFGQEHLAWILREQYAERAAAADARARALAELDVSGLAVAVPVAPDAEPRPAAPHAPAMAPPDLRDAHWGGDARPAFRAGPLLVDARPVTNAEYARFVTAAGRPRPPHWAADIPDAAILELPVTHVTVEDARAYASWAKKRLPSLDEWRAVVAALGAPRLSTGVVWEWTRTTLSAGHAVCGGAWRDRPGEPADPENVSHQTGPASDVGFRCVADA